MATTIQQIELPKKARALDTSSGWQTVGSNLTTNGDFATGDFTSWSNTTQNFGAKSIVGGAARLDATAASDSLIQIFQDMGLVSGKRYRITFTITNHNGDTSTSSLINNSGSTLYAITGNGVNLTFDFTHSISDARLFFRASNGSKYDIDNITLLELQNFPNNNHGQIYSGRGLEFDGISDHLLTGYGNGLNPYTTPITVAIWAKTSTTGGKIFIGPTAGTNQRFYIGLNNGVLDMGIQNSQWATTTNEVSGFSDQPSYEVDMWYRIVIVMSAGQATMYVNGVKSYAKTYTSYVFSSDITIGNFNPNASFYWNGMLSDAQIWDAAFTQADVTYDYLNPELLALNGGGTALTESNLKLWYPMQDGHRGQQSYILDGANTGAVVELVTNGDFANGETDWTFSSQCEVVNDQARILSTDGAFQYISQNNVFDTSKNYKLEFDVISSNGATLGLGGGIPDVQTTTLGRKTIYTSPSTTYLQIKRSSGVTDVVIDNVSVKAINDKHHATTVFYGDEILDNPTFTSDLSDWTLSSSTAPTYVSGNMQMNSDGVTFSYARQSFTTVVGRTYGVSGNITVHGSSNTMKSVQARVELIC